MDIWHNVSYVSKLLKKTKTKQKKTKKKGRKKSQTNVRKEIIRQRERETEREKDFSFKKTFYKIIVFSQKNSKNINTILSYQKILGEIQKKKDKENRMKRKEKKKKNRVKVDKFLSITLKLVYLSERINKMMK